MIIVTQSTVASLTPSVQTTVFRNTGTVGGATSSVHHKLALHCLNQLRSINIPKMSKKRALFTAVIIKSITISIAGVQMFKLHYVLWNH